MDQDKKKGQPDEEVKEGEDSPRSSSVPGDVGLATGLQPGGTAPGGGTGAGEGSIGAGGGSTADRATGNVKSEGR